jgi:hypothetical protein
MLTQAQDSLNDILAYCDVVGLKDDLVKLADDVNSLIV